MGNNGTATIQHAHLPHPGPQGDPMTRPTGRAALTTGLDRIEITTPNDGWSGTLGELLRVDGDTIYFRLCDLGLYSRPDLIDPSWQDSTVPPPWEEIRWENMTHDDWRHALDCPNPIVVFA